MIPSESTYDPSAVGVKGTIFGLPFNESDASVIYLPVPWDATVSYASGTAHGPQAILDASTQLDLEVVTGEAPWKRGLWMAPISEEIQLQSDSLRNQVEPYIEALESGKVHMDADQIMAQVNAATLNLKDRIRQSTLEYLHKGKLVGLVGGDHSCPLGYMEALGEFYGEYGILQIDAHMDLRCDYEGFQHSHASIMYNAMQLSQITRLVQVGIRDFCEEEVAFAEKQASRVAIYYEEQLKREQFSGKNWQLICKEIISQLPQQVYISFDIDGLDPQLCPGTGTPVPGGLSFGEVIFLLQQVKASGRQVIGFDLCEVAPQAADKEWNANVGARVLYVLSGLI